MNANTKWQLLIFDEVVRSKLLYGLETIQLTGAMLKKIDAFQIRCLKRILRIPSTFTDRQNPNRVVLQRCTEILYQNQGTNGNLNFLADLITAENPDHWVMYLDLEMKILCVKFHSNLAVQ